MENKLNLPALEEYAIKYSELLTEKLFSNRKAISGQKIIEEISVKQVGLFVLFNLYRRWKLEMAQLKSPYFNYESHEVKGKLKELMNMLSKHINIEKDDFRPLLSKSIENTLLLIMSPLNYYEGLVESYKGIAPDMDEVKDLERFIKINGHMRDALLTSWASNLSGKELFDKAFEGLSEPPEDVEKLVAPFNELLPIEIDKFWLESESGVLADGIEEEEETKEVEKEVELETIHTQFAEEKTSLLADSLGFENAQSSFKVLLTINQKFMFINDLFNGSKEDFNKVIDFLDTCETKDVVIKFIHNNYIQRGSWKQESPQVKEFFALVDNKFA